MMKFYQLILTVYGHPLWKNASSLSIEIIFLLAQKKKRAEQFDSIMIILGVGINNYNIGPCFSMLCKTKQNKDKHIKLLLA